jgi:hypothetical protein
MNEHQTITEPVASGISRRRFFGYAGALAGAGLLTGIGGCKKSDNGSGIDLGSGDIGILNYAYALEQLEAAFYIQITQLPYVGITPAEQAYLNDIGAHEVAHREFFKAALGSNAIQSLTPNFSSVDFHDRTSVLTTARTFEDLGVSAYNGAGKLFSNTTDGAKYLGLAGKIVSVEARHAAIIRELLYPDTFADTTILDPVNRIDMAREPNDVLAIAGAYLYESLYAGNLPTT